MSSHYFLLCGDYCPIGNRNLGFFTFIRDICQESSWHYSYRKNLSVNGYLEITLLVSNNGKIKKPIISFKGIPESSENENFIFDMEDEIFSICRKFSLESKNQEKNLIETIKQNCRKIIKEKTGKKPFTNINIARI